MSARRLFFLDTTHLTAYRWQGGHVHYEEEFASDAAGLEAFAEYARRHRSSQFLLLTDVAEEGFQIEDVPSIQGRDRRALIQRKLSQYFYGTPYSLALSLGRHKDGRRDERMLFAALTRPPQIEPWLAALREVEAQLAGVFSLSLVAAPLLSQIADGSESKKLLITITHGGLRQTYFERGQIAFSRLTPLVTGTVDEMALACAAEAEKMYHYLLAQRIVSRGTALATTVLAHPAQVAAFRSRCIDTTNIHFEFADLLGLSGKLGLKTPPKDTHSELLFLHLLARRPPRQQFAAAADRHFFHLGQLRFGLQSAGAVIFAACLLFAGRQAIEVQAIDQQNSEVAAQTQADRQRYEGILQGLPKVPLTTDNLRALIGRYETLLDRSRGMEPMYAAISRALQESPRVELNRIDWNIVGPRKDAGAGGAPGTVPAATAAGESADLSGQLPVGMVSDHRAQLAAIEGFAGRLKAASLQVQILKLPFEAESSKTLKSSGDAVAQVQAPQFLLRVTGKPNKS